MVEKAREFLKEVEQKLGVRFVRVYLLYLRVLSILLEVGEISLQDLLNMIEPELRDVKLVRQILEDLEALSIISLQDDYVKFNYNKYEEVRASILRGEVDTCRLRVLGPLLNLFREFASRERQVMRRGLPESK